MKKEDLIYDWNQQAPLPNPQHLPTLDDETLRDGLQSPSAHHPTIEEKKQLLHLMDQIGIHQADIGLPGASPQAKNHCLQLAKEIAHSKLKIIPNCAARTLIQDITPISDIQQATGIPIVADIFIGSSQIRQYTENWNLNQILKHTEEAIAFCQKQNLEVMYVTEDTTRTHPHILQQLYSHAIRCGAKRITIADTVGHATPWGAFQLVQFIRHIVQSLGAYDVKIDWHGHRDRGLAIANSLAAYLAGAHQIHATALGIGERCGNTPMELLLVNLYLMNKLHTTQMNLSKLQQYTQLASKILKIPIPSNYPVFGNDAFETATGVHAAAIIKAIKKQDNWLINQVYSGVPANVFGKEQSIRIGPMSGKSNVIYWLEHRGLPTKPQWIEKIFQKAKISNRLLNDEEILQLIQE